MHEGAMVMMMKTEIMTNELLGTRPEKDWRPADYLPLATSLRAEGVGKSFSLVTPEHVVLTARCRAHVAEQERQLRELSDELRRLRHAQGTPERYQGAGKAGSRHLVLDWLRSLVTGGAL
jgi:hypothetical protein